MADYLVEVKRINSKVVAQQRHEHLVTRCQMDRRKCRRVHVDEGLTGHDRLIEGRQLGQNSMKIVRVILVRPPHEENRDCAGRAQNDQK